jgi:hypothetical protein
MDGFRPTSNEGHVQVVCGDEPVTRLVFLRRAAEDGYAPAMRSLATECRDPHERRYWLRRAANTDQAIAATCPFADTGGDSRLSPRRLPK